ncbi:hypothetical protein [Pseudoalteromonas sp. NC201]|uniref:hypothetical protein n=1 Tax=Pseudoalteromonas sp. NC201 TaxID=1514074 RepID=UPI000C795CD4|nr:hypothetical protein [Pseudoalteromonas sp. NC201]
MKCGKGVAGAPCGFLTSGLWQLKTLIANPIRFETLAKERGKVNNNKSLYAMLFMFYYTSCIELGLPKKSNPDSRNRSQVLGQYKESNKGR